jgi:hypothetical protein
LLDESAGKWGSKASNVKNKATPQGFSENANDAGATGANLRRFCRRAIRSLEVVAEVKIAGFVFHQR